MDSAPRYRTVIGATSLIVGPALMSVGDLLHPAEDMVPAAQVAIITQQSAGRWYAAHLLLFVGILLLVPGFLTLSRLAMDRRPKAGYAARLLMLVSVGAFSAVLVFEMVLGRFIAGGADRAAAIALLEISQSPAIIVAVVPGLLAFFVGTGLLVVSLASVAGPFRWPALCLALGAVLILAEIILAQVILSQIGNVLILVSGIAVARLLLRGAE